MSLFIKYSYDLRACRVLPIIFAVTTVIATFVIFFAAARFRSHGLPLFAIGSGIFITAIIDWKKTGVYKTIVLIFLSLILGALTIWSGNKIADEPANLMEFAWGYIKMNQPEQAQQYAYQQIETNPEDAGPYELLGYVALRKKQYPDAILFFKNATQLAPQHHIAQYNLAISLNKTKQYTKSLAAVESAIDITALPEYLFLQGKILEQMGNTRHALKSYEYLINKDNPSYSWQLYSNKAQKRLKDLRQGD